MSVANLYIICHNKSLEHSNVLDFIIVMLVYIACLVYEEYNSLAFAFYKGLNFEY